MTFAAHRDGFLYRPYPYYPEATPRGPIRFAGLGQEGSTSAQCGGLIEAARELGRGEWYKKPAVWLLIGMGAVGGFVIGRIL